MANQWFREYKKGEVRNSFYENYIWQKSSVNDNEGYVYLIKCGEYHKIGRSSIKYFLKRMSAYKTHNPYETILVRYVKVADQNLFEKILHLTFSCFLHRGEWYEFTDGSLEAVIEIFETYGKQKNV